MTKMCIFEKNIVCSNCGECNICDLNKNKLCNNCGKCLELEGYDVKAIEIDDLFESEEEYKDFEVMDNIHKEDFDKLSEDSVMWDYIDDIKEVSDLIKEEEEEGRLYEEFPWLLKLRESGRE